MVKWKSAILDVPIENAFHGGTLGVPNNNHHKAFHTMSDKIKFNIKKNAKDVVLYPAGSTIFKKGEMGDCMYAIADGEVDVVVEGNVVETLTSGDLFGEMAIIDRQPRSADTVAKTDCHILKIDEKKFLFMTDHTPRFALQVMRLVAARLRERMADLERLQAGN